MSGEPLAVGACSWSLRVGSVPELAERLRQVGTDVVQIACGDPHHASWAEGDAMPAAARAAGFRMTGAMIGFPGEDYTTPQSIARTGGFGDPATRAERREHFRWGLRRTVELGLADVTLHAGFIPPVGDPARRGFLDTLIEIAAEAGAAGVTAAFETGQEPSTLLRRTLDDLGCPNLKVNFDPANMLLYDQDDPLEAIERLAPDIRSVHAKDAVRPTTPGTWGAEVPLGTGQTDTAAVIRTLLRVGFRGPICVEREVGSPDERVRDIAAGVALVRQLLAAG